MRSSNFFQSIAVACLGSTNTRSWPSLSKNLGFLVTIVRVVFFRGYLFLFSATTIMLHKSFTEESPPGINGQAH